MGRRWLTVGVVLACVASRASAAEITEVATAAEVDDALDFRLSVRWDRLQEKSLITREHALGAAEAPPYGALEDLDQLRYTRTANVIVPRVAFGIYRGLELHAELPYVLNDDRSWRYALVNGQPVDGIPGYPTVGSTTIDAMNRTCPGGQPCPLFSVPSTVYHGGVLGDFVVGLAWAVTEQKKDETTATWVVGVDVTAPTAKRYDPAEGRVLDTGVWGDSPYAVEAKKGPLGERVWKYDFWTALSRRYGSVEPYIRGHVTAVRPSTKTYSNCEHADALSTATPAAQMTLAGAENCKDPQWKGDSGAQLPWLAGANLGLEIIAFDKPSTRQKVSIDLRGTAEFRSAQRFYNPLTDATGKLLFSESFYTLGGRAGLYLKGAHFGFDLTGTYEKQLDHFVTGEALGKSGVNDTGKDITGATSNPLLNPNYDWRWDAPGRRFRQKESNVFLAAAAFHLDF